MSGRCDCGRPISANKTQCLECTSKPGGVLEILNCQAGDIKISFDKANITETIRAKRIITDMLRRGFALIVEVERDGEKKYERVQAFDEGTAEYVICDFDPLAARESDMDEGAWQLRKEHEAADRQREAAERKAMYEKDYAADPDNISAVLQPVATADGEVPEKTPGKKDGRGKWNRRRLPMETTKATAVGRSAGG